MRAICRLAISALLGMPAALLAHAFIFGNGHLAGGAFHAAFAQGGTACAFAALGAVLAASVRGRRSCAPYLAAIALATAAALAAIEAVESSHRIPLLLCLFAVAFAAALAYAAVHAFSASARAVAAVLSTRAKIAVSRCDRAGAFAARLLRINSAWHFALFSRPPPLLS